MNPVLDKLKQYPIAMLGGLVLLVCALLLFIRGDKAGELLTLEDELNARILTINANAKNSKNLPEDVEALESDVAQISERLFDQDDRSINRNFLYSFEDRLDIQILDVNQQSAVSDSFAAGAPNALKVYATINYDISVKGEFEELVKFFYEIHTASAFMRIEGFQLSQAGGRGGADGTLSARLNVSVLAEKESK